MKEQKFTPLDFARQAKPETLARSEFDVVWTKWQEGHTYALVRVPKDEPFAVHYAKPRNKINVVMQPTQHPEEWTLSGTINPRIVGLLGLSTTPGERRESPTMTKEQIESLGQYGIVKSKFSGLLEVSLKISPTRITDMFREIWRPGEFHEANTKSFILEPQDNSDRILPEKEILPKQSSRSKTTLKVKRIAQ